MLRGMPPVVQHKSSELPASDGSAHALPRLLKLPVIARRNYKSEEAATSTLYHGNACNTAQNVWYCCSSNNRSLAILARRLCSESRIYREFTGFSRESPRWAQQLAKWTPGLTCPLSRSR